MILAVSNVCNAFMDKTIGTKVLDKETVLSDLYEAVEKHDFSEGDIPGQGYLQLPHREEGTVRTGVGARSLYPEDYHARLHRGRIELYLMPHLAAPCEGLAAIVYTIEAYLADPETDEEENARFVELKTTHVLVALLAYAGPKAPLDEIRLISNLAGGNREALLWDGATVRAKARETKAYFDQWCVVAD